jgi:porin
MPRALGASALLPVAFVAAVAIVVLAWGEAEAAPPPMTIPNGKSFENLPKEPCGEEIADGLKRSSSVLGSICGLRTWLGRKGVSLGLAETSELLGDLRGGASRGFDYDGLTTAVMQLDTQRAFGHYGGTLQLSALQIHGANLSAQRLFTLQTASGIEADPATRLWELWYQQQFGRDENHADVKIGQQSLDQEFMVSQNALMFVNTMFGWPMLPSADLPGGGPAYPLSALGVRVRLRPTPSWTVLAGVFNGSPVAVPLNGGALAIAEAQYVYPSLGTIVYANQTAPLARTYKIGVWYDTETFPDEEFAPAEHQGDWAAYAVADQMIWQDRRDADRTMNLFLRVMGTPLTDRNLIDESVNAGFTFHEPFLHRDDDSFGLGMGYTHVSPSVSALDAQTAVLTGAFVPIQSTETFVEATYQYQVFPWLQVQPDLQYVFNPGAGVANPYDPSQRIRNELVGGVRTNISL